MKKQCILLTMLMLVALTAAAKKVKVTIDGFVPKHQEQVCIIVNEDLDNIMEVPVNDGRFTVKMKIDADAFIRIYEGGYLKNYPDRAYFILIPDSKHITVNTTDPFNYTIEGSEMSEKLQQAIRKARQNSPEGFHIDVFSDDPQAWADAKAAQESTWKMMRDEQMKDITTVINDNKSNIIPVWMIYIYGRGEYGPQVKSFLKDNSKWGKHILMQKLLSE